MPSLISNFLTITLLLFTISCLNRMEYSKYKDYFPVVPLTAYHCNQTLLSATKIAPDSIHLCTALIDMN